MEDLQALATGLRLGGQTGNRVALAGMVPTAGSPRGAAPPVDPLVPQFRQIISQVDSLAQALQRMGDQRRSADAQDISVKLQRMSIDRQNDIAKAGTSMGGDSNAMPTQFPQVDGGGTLP